MSKEINNEMFVIAGEPTIVTEARCKVLQEFDDLEFYEEGHRYYLHGKQLLSASSIGARYIKNPFDEQAQAQKYAAKNGGTPEYWITQWRKNSFRACTLGTKTHAFGETLGYLRAGITDRIHPLVSLQYNTELNYLAPIHEREEALTKFFDDMSPSMHLVLNEAKAYSGKNPDPARNPKEQICGTFDMLYYYDGGGDDSSVGFVILDYKTNSSLTNEYNRKFRRVLKAPFDDMIEEDLSLYAIQLSLYAMMIEDIGFHVIDRQLVWLHTDTSGQPVYSIHHLEDVSETLRKEL